MWELASGSKEAFERRDAVPLTFGRFQIELWSFVL